MTVATIIYQQLGGNKFMVMTGAKQLSSIPNGIEFSLPRNKSKANRFKVVLDQGADLYDVTFSKFALPRLSSKTGELTGGEAVELSVTRRVDAESLRAMFTDYTGLFTSMQD